MKVTKGHLTATEKRAIKAILGSNLLSGRVSNKDYFLTKTDTGYDVVIAVKDRGMIPCPGSPLRISRHNHSFIL